MNIRHSWYNKHAHIFRTDGRVVRATMKDIILDRGAVYMKTEFVDDAGNSRIKHMSPITVAALQVLWVNVDVVSDLDLPDTDDVDVVTNFIPPRECDRLPSLHVYMEKTPEIECMLLQVNMFITLCTTSIPLSNTPPVTPLETPPITPFLQNPVRTRRSRRSTRPRKGRDTLGAWSGS